MLDTNAIADSMMAKGRRQRPLYSVSCHISEDTAMSIIDKTILDGLEKQSFFPLQELTKITCISTMSCNHSCLWESIFAGFTTASQ
jgi:hypothetical protein